MATHFIADVHLRDSRDDNAERLIRYLAGPARGAEALYVLGDLFDVWIGDDGSLERHRPVLAAFAALAHSGVPVYFMRGNRDFAVGDAFIAASRMQIVDDPLVIDCHGTPTLLTHGDMLCSDDPAHQVFRAPYTDAAWRARMLKIPLWLRRLLAIYARRRSRAGKQHKAAYIMDINADKMVETMREHRVIRLIHGHTHRPADHRLLLDGCTATRHVLSDWRPDRAEVLMIDAERSYRMPLVDGHTNRPRPTDGDG